MSITEHLSTDLSDDEIYGRSALINGEPWIVPGSLTFLKSIVQPTWKVFEWGSGGSTVFFGRHCKSVFSVEHNSEWIKRTANKLQAANITNVTQLYRRGLPEDKPDRFRPYADTINVYPDESFDLIFVDGEASSRSWCIANAIPKLKPGGWLLVDNSNLFHSKSSHVWDEWERDDYIAKGLKWVGQPGTFDWWTSIMRKPE